MRRAAVLLLLAMTLVPSAAALADDPVFVIEFEDGKIRPAKLVVPADTRFKLELRNVGASPVEFESLQLRKEKIIAPGVITFIVFRRLAPGEYDFFDDFHLDTPPARLVAVDGGKE